MDGEGVMPLLRERGLWSPPDGTAADPCSARSVPFAADYRT